MSLGNNIRIVRKRKGFKLVELAEKAGITAGALSLIERDRRRPSESTIEKIAKALLTTSKEVKGSFLSTYHKDDKDIDKEVEILFARLNQATPTDKYLVKKHLMDLPDPTVFAVEVRKELGVPEGPLDPLNIANALGIKVKEDFFEGFEAALVKTESKNLILVKTGLNLGRKNFVIAHELGHFRLPSHADPGYTCHINAVETYQINELFEQEANQFAAELLLPEKALGKFLRRKIPSILLAQKLASKYVVSNTMAILRIVEMSSIPCALVVSVGGVRKWFKRSPAFMNFIDIGTPISTQALANQILIKSCSREVTEGSRPIVGESPVSAWISTGGFRRNAKLIEESLFVPPYDTILTLLKFK